ncbi:hypothetical protein CAPTEDRAFT_19918 [Capitella teleta]|uniref:Endoplasmic reticulum vesicle transporter C-terminal domain-containing protein n=1 Tax=Capitella teleta TaxID=283909 RepID=R7UW33_CAPTE|nr:hypothetical protein CAPTEDRAFT_19918 [Capitella teleta]|eukprot:ELU08142.1 hypothetical protein CAPTEDRAFT_19918 [Capitella teleta]
MQLRNRKAFKVVRELDAFPKVPEGYQECSASGGSISILVLVLSAILIISEIRYYTATEFKYDYEVDKHFEGKLSINIDITVAMKCHQVGADVLDITGQNVASFGKLTEEEVHFELSPNQRKHLKSMSAINEYIRNEYHSIHKFLWRSGFGGYLAQMPPREDHPQTPKNGCRFYGTLDVNKVAGNFHITAGKSVPLNIGGHAHMAMMVKESDYNFTHRIEHFSFGDKVSGRINPLDGEEKNTNDNYHMYQYFIQVVPTHVKTLFTDINTYQFSVTEQNRTISHGKGSHGIPGIFVKYDLAPMMVKVIESHKPFSQLLIRLCGIIGGLFATSGMLHGMAGFLVDVVCCRYGIGAKHQSPTAKREAEAVKGRHGALGPSVASQAGRLTLQNMQQGLRTFEDLSKEV